MKQSGNQQHWAILLHPSRRKVVTSGIGPFFVLRQREKGSLRAIFHVRHISLALGDFFRKKS